MLQHGWTLQTSREPVTRNHVLQGSIYVKYLKRKKVDKWLPRAGGEGWEAEAMMVRRNEASFWGDGNVLKPTVAMCEDTKKTKTKPKKPTDLYTCSGWIVHCVNHISEKLLGKKIIVTEGRNGQMAPFSDRSNRQIIGKDVGDLNGTPQLKLQIPFITVCWSMFNNSSPGEQTLICSICWIPPLISNHQQSVTDHRAGKRCTESAFPLVRCCWLVLAHKPDCSISKNFVSWWLNTGRLK